jgi:hypothetical protein
MIFIGGECPTGSPSRGAPNISRFLVRTSARSWFPGPTIGMGDMTLADAFADPRVDRVARPGDGARPDRNRTRERAGGDTSVN